MGRITLELLRRRAEHNGGQLASLQEVSLHGQGIERIELLNQLCRHLRILYLQNNLVARIENLHRLKELEQINLAVNNLTRVGNLAGCESLRRLDLTANFIALRGLPSLASLRTNAALEELHLLGNPCTRWAGCRQYVLGLLPQLRRLDGEEVRPSERIAARQALPELQQALQRELLAEGVNPDANSEGEDDSLAAEADSMEETGYVDEAGELRRPWCPATRVLDHREQQRQAEAAEERQRAAQQGIFGDGASGELPPRERLPELVEGAPIYQKNEGKWDFSLEESDCGSSMVLSVALERYLDSSLIQADVQPTFVRLLIKGRLLQLVLPAEVLPDASSAQRSRATGRLVLTMPKAAHNSGRRHVGSRENCNLGNTAPGIVGMQAAGGKGGRYGGTGTASHRSIVRHGDEEQLLCEALGRAAVCEVASDAADANALPPLA